MIESLRQDLDYCDGVASLLAPGPSTQVMPDELRRGVELSLNNVDESCKYQMLFDPIESESDVVLYHDVLLEGGYDGMNQYSPSGVDQPGWIVKTEDYNDQNDPLPYYPLHENGSINARLNSVACGLVTLIQHGAEEIRIFGQDGCDPRGKGWSRWDGVPRDEHYFELIAANHRRFEQVCCVANTAYNVTLYNLSPFSDIEGTERLFDKYGKTESYKTAQV